VRGPKHVVKTGKTIRLDADKARTLLDSIDISTLVGPCKGRQLETYVLILVHQ
jgi:hypothetical protein